MRELARVDLNSLALETRQTFVLPRGWNSVRGVQLGDAPRLAQVNGVQVPILAFLVRTDRRASHATGVLVRIPRSRWQGTAASPSFSSAPIQYASFGTWAVWSEVDTVFVCLLQGDPQAMQRLQELVSGRRELT